MIISSQVCGKFLLRTSSQARELVSKLGRRWIESNAEDCRNSKSLGQTTILLQDGANIQELPLIVKRISDIGVVCNTGGKDNAKSADSRAEYTDASRKKDRFGLVICKEDQEKAAGKTGIKTKSRKHRIDIESEEGTAILFSADLEYLKRTDIEELFDGLNSSNTPKGTYSSLESKIADEINSRIALQALRKIIESENVRQRYKHAKAMRQEQLVANAIERDAVLKQLVKMIARSQDGQAIIEGLCILKKDKFSPSRNIYKDCLSEEALIRATDGDFSISQLIDVAKAFSSFRDSRYQNLIDVLWVGLASREKDITADVLVPLFKLIYLFDQSKNMVRIILERKLSEHWLRLTGSQMGEILNCYQRDTILSSGCLTSASKWASVSMNTSKERDLVDFIQSLHAKKYIDDRIERALEEYTRAKGISVKDPQLIASITSYCGAMRVRNANIIANCGEYFIQYGKDLPASLLAPILTPFGLLGLQPPQSTSFWKVFDEAMAERIFDLKPNELLDILLSCIYLEKYPLKFIEIVFKSHSLDTIWRRKNSIFIKESVQYKLILFDTSMYIECENYRHFRVGSDKIKSLFVDVRIRRIINEIYQPLARMVGKEKKLSRGVILSKLPLIDFYVLDILIHSSSVSTPILDAYLQCNRNLNTVVLIHLPEYYCRNTNHLIGPQATRKRQIRKLGFRVVSLDYVTLEKFLDRGDELSDYLIKRFEAAEEAL
ncbi:hypothetical protein KPH14_006081 [Odynerus spinipes]|uniref:RAP domain-containing protein n=1 Tax=Odynerus spinipes TaxID=1348599 RepID=A0AAD9RJS1_9HYME|nr:hypothetical protein KPH14_006081 [Odynerus spinipes]